MNILKWKHAKKRLWTRFGDSSIRSKIIAVYLPVVAVPFLLLGLISNQLFSKTYISETTRTVLDDSHLISARIGWTFNEAESCANMVLTGVNNVVLYNRLRDSTPSLPIERRTQILNHLEFAKATFQNIDALAFMDIQGDLITDNPKMEVNSMKALTSSLLEEIKATSGETVRFREEIRDFLTVDSHQPVVTLGKKVLDINTGDTLGYLFLVIKTGDLSAQFKGIGETQGRYYRLLNEQEEVIATNRPGEVLLSTIQPTGQAWTKGRDSAMQEVNGETFLVTRVNVRGTSWTLESGTPLRYLTKELRRNNELIVGTGTVCLILALSGAYFLSRMIGRPLKQLHTHMRQVRNGELHVRLDRKEKDEFGYLAQGFNSMVFHIRKLIEQVADEQRQKRETELTLMNEQIKPHFLYNTLDLIYVLCDMNRPVQARDATKALASFYRGALSGGKDLISLQEEIQLVESYLIIQGYRYSDVLGYEISIPAASKPIIIPKLTLQPLVENAIYHGIKPTGWPGVVRIKGELTDGMLLLIVQDNGRGMTNEQRDHLLAGTPDRGFGVANVVKRLRLYFGYSVGLSIVSGSEGTTVMLRLPLGKEENHVQRDDG
ncbi:sensor histidine kinase [Paenibacillus sp. LHD-117]|uniref:cache domain-containing sensor histidine kinase n=1 Tax=Paenibacillus sp. LHD-117 TaxID=3071412 RepID=UPI0027E1526D|nr:sensor histidine kinase [Paenibacillus sp. LHD-117]MDQ6420504.1 sensor histidine kinase [Paenibacillus sp. LHD-117]